MKFYNTFRSQFELFPRITIIYGGDEHGIALEWLWFGVFFYVTAIDINTINK